MRENQSLFGDMTDVCVVLLLAAIALGCAARRGGLSYSRHSLGRFHRDECGASYALPYVMTFPVYFLVVCLMIQATLILIIKIGTVYAAHAAVRAAVVWRSDEPEAADEDVGHMTAENKAQQAAVFAMTPFASSQPFHLERFEQRSPTWGEQQMAEQYYSAYVQIARDNVRSDQHDTTQFMPNPDETMSRRRVTAKYRFASAATRVIVAPDPNEWNAEVTAIVTYRMPMHVPAVGRILGQGTAENYHARTIETRATIPSEVPKSDNHRLGIEYDAGT